MINKHGDDLAVDILIQILEHTCQTDILLHLQFSETTKPPGIFFSQYSVIRDRMATDVTKKNAVGEIKGQWYIKQQKGLKKVSEVLAYLGFIRVLYRIILLLKNLKKSLLNFQLFVH